MKSQREVSAVLFLGLALLVGGTRSAQAKSAREVDCQADPAWATNPSLPDFRKEPASVCAFHQYAWQSFLYVTQRVPQGGLVFETFPSISDILKLPTDPDCSVDKANGKSRIFTHLLSKSRSGEITQAGSSGVLVDQRHKVTYYEQYFNGRFASFVDHCRFEFLACQKTQEAADLRTPLGSLELKASWQPISREDPNYNRFYTIKDVLLKDPQIIGGKNQCVTTDLALVGFHLVYAPAGHPELVWATFEHVANAPDGPCTGKATTPPAGFKKWTYNNSADPDCSTSHVNHWQNATPAPYPIVQAVRNWAYGNDPNQAAAQENIHAIEALNRSVAGGLPADSVWKNYYLVGTVWTVNGALPPTQPSLDSNHELKGGNLGGSDLLANVTMETFRQTEPDLSATKSCFFCHTAEQKHTYLVSHVFEKTTTDGQAALRCPWEENPVTHALIVPAACLATQSTPKTAGTTAAPALIPSH